MAAVKLQMLTKFTIGRCESQRLYVQLNRERVPLLIAINPLPMAKNFHCKDTVVSQMAQLRPYRA